MRAQTHYKELEQSPWMDQLIMKKINKLDRYLSPDSLVTINFTESRGLYLATILISNGKNQQEFSGEGLNLYEAFSASLEMAVKTLSEHRRKLKKKVQERFSAVA